MSGYLPLSIPVFLNSFNNLFVTLLPVTQRTFLKYRIQVRSRYITVTFWYVGNVPAFLDMGKQALDKIVFSQNGLPLDLSPDRIFADSQSYELPVLRLCF
jgi:hypothetical protein